MEHWNGGSFLVVIIDAVILSISKSKIDSSPGRATVIVYKIFLKY